MVTAELVFISEGCKQPQDMLYITIFFAFLYLVSTILLMFRIEQNRRLKRENNKLKRKIRRIKNERAIKNIK